MANDKDGGLALPRIIIFRGKTNLFGTSLEREIEVDPDNLYPFTRVGYYGPCMACDADLHKGAWYERVGQTGRRYWCCDCVERILTGTTDAMLAERSKSPEPTDA